MHSLSFVVNFTAKWIEPLGVPKDKVNVLFELIWRAKVAELSQRRWLLRVVRIKSSELILYHLEANRLLDYLQVVRIVCSLPEGVIELCLLIFLDHELNDLIDEISTRLLSAADTCIEHVVVICQLLKHSLVFKHPIARLVHPYCTRTAPEHNVFIRLSDEF